MLLIKEADVRRLLPMDHAIRLVENAFGALAAQAAQNQPRRRLTLPGGSVLHQLAAACGPYFGTKIYSTHPRHGAHFLVLLYDAATARPLALIEANHLGQIRTGAASGVATRWLARPDAAVLAVIGSGFQAVTQVEAVRAVRPIREVRVWSRDETRRRAFAAAAGALPAPSAEAALAGAQIIVTATNSRDPVLDDAWVAPGAHINAVGSNQPRRRELPAALVARASLIAVDDLDQARLESGDLLLAWQESDWRSPRLVPLADVIIGGARRSTEDEITLFKSNGIGLEDVAVAGFVYEQALATGAGVELKDLDL